jgi:hypothetical protein
MSDYPSMSHDELIAALRSDMAATAAERDANAVTTAAEMKKRADAEAEIARLEQGVRFYPLGTPPDSTDSTRRRSAERCLQCRQRVRGGQWGGLGLQ